MGFNVHIDYTHIQRLRIFYVKWEHVELCYIDSHIYVVGWGCIYKMLYELYMFMFNLCIPILCDLT